MNRDEPFGGTKSLDSRLLFFEKYLCVYCFFSDENRLCGNSSNGDIRLVGGASDSEGRVEICLDGVWGTICENFWSNLDAVVVCRQLGFSIMDATAFQGGQYGPGTGPIFLNNVFCNGGEAVLTDCTHSDGSQTDCSHYQDAGVICPGTYILLVYKTLEGQVVISMQE